MAGVLGIGVDIVRTARFSEILARHPHRLNRLAARILHPEERIGLTLANAPQRLASAWAAKEALYKSLGAEQKDCRFNKWRKCSNVRLVADGPRSDAVLLSISHDGDYTVAFVTRIDGQYN